MAVRQQYLSLYTLKVTPGYIHRWFNLFVQFIYSIYLCMCFSDFVYMKEQRTYISVYQIKHTEIKKALFHSYLKLVL